MNTETTTSREIHYFATVALDGEMLTDTKGGILGYGYDCEGCEGKCPGADGGWEYIDEVREAAESHECTEYDDAPVIALVVTDALRGSIEAIREARESDGAIDASASEIELEDAIIWHSMFDSGPDPDANQHPRYRRCNWCGWYEFDAEGNCTGDHSERTAEIAG